MTFKAGQSGNPSGGRAEPRTQRARVALAKLVDKNSERMGEWLDTIAEEQGPQAAWNCFVNVIEYALPKLARTEHTGEGGGPVVHTIERKVIWPPKER